MEAHGVGRRITLAVAGGLALLITTAAHAQQVYWAQTFGDRIRRANLNGTNAQTLIEPPVAFDPVAIRLDVSGGKLYWAEVFENTIRRANLDGTGIQTVVQPPAIIDPIALDVDAFNLPAKVYWAQSFDDKILRANFDGSGVETIVAPPVSFDVVAIAVSPSEGKVYWAENPGNRIRRANLDGSNAETFLDVFFVSDPVALAVDVSCGDVYWAERSANRIRHATPDGLTVETLVDSVFANDPVAVAVVTAVATGCGVGTVYWAEGLSSRIRRVSPGGGVTTIVEAPSVFDPVSVDVDPGLPGPPMPSQDAAPNDTTRYLSLSVPPNVTSGPPPIPEPTALRVRLVDLQNPVPPNPPGNLPPSFSAFETGPTCTDPGGCVRWVGEPSLFRESQDSPGAGTFWGARLQCTPVYFDWSTVGVFHVTGAEIAPSSKFDIENLDSFCTGNEATCTDMSAALRVNTARHGDVVTPFNPPSPSVQPDALDVNAVVAKFKGLIGSPNKAHCQIQPNLPELNADTGALDILACVDAFKGLAYPFSGPCVCPSTVTCGVTPCANPNGCPNGTCVRTCVGGTQAGLPCVVVAHCPGGTCGQGFCRDRCGRCTP